MDCKFVKLGFFHQPLLDTADGVVEIHIDLVKLFVLRSEWQGVMLFVDLSQGFLSRALQFELHHVDIILCLYHEVAPSFRSVVFRLSVESQKLEGNEKYILVMPFQVACQFVRAVGKETLEAFHKGVYPSLLHIRHKMDDFESGIFGRQVGVAWEEKAYEAFFHLLVGESQGIAFETPVVILDGEIVALVEDGYGVFFHSVDVVERIGRRHFPCQAVQVIMVAFQQFDQESGRARFESVIFEFTDFQGVNQDERVVKIFPFAGKVVSVVPFFQLLASFRISHVVSVSQFLYTFRKDFRKFVFGDATKVVIVGLQGDVFQIVQVSDTLILLNLVTLVSRAKRRYLSQLLSTP